jgi:acyl transferase domain-containing protein
MAAGAMNGGESGREIALVGMAGRFPGARDLHQFWQNLRDGREAVTFLPAEELAAAGVGPELLADPHYVRAASLLEGVELFDAPFFGYTAREAEILDPQQRLFLEQAWTALEDAGCSPSRYEGLIGVYAGVAWNTYLLSNLTSHPGLFGDGGFQVFVASDKDFLPTRVSYKLNLRGPSMVVQTSCSTSLVAVHLACLSLLNYECDLALAGGVTVKVPQRQGYLHQEGGLASPDGHCRAFDARAAGTIFGSGIGVVALKRLADARADGDAIRAVIRGSAVNNDGSLKVSYTAPSVEGQAEVIAAAQAIAAVDPATIGYVEAHGTGTSLGDPIEIAALTKVFREATAGRGFCAVGSVKTNVGHLDAAAGVAGLIKTVLALEHRQIPPSLNFSQANPAIDFAASPFRVNAALCDWPADGAPRRAAVSSFGVGGTNAHLILEEAPAPPAAAAPARPWQLLLLSARSAEALEAATENLADHLADRPELDAAGLADVAHTLDAGRTVFRHRRALVARDAADAAEALRRRDPARLLAAADAEEPRERPVAFMFPGQGTQHPGMARALYEGEEVFRLALDQCAELLRPALGRDLRLVLYPQIGERAAWKDTDRAAAAQDAESLAAQDADSRAATREVDRMEAQDADRAVARRELTSTALAQPALFAVEYALAELWISWGVRPAAMIGHSVGEYVAACLAGVMPLAGALALVAARGRLMQELPAGAMVSVPLSAAALADLLPPEAAVAALNEPERTVASGPLAAIQELERRLAAAGVASRRLHTSHAFHSPMMEPAVEPFLAEVRKLRLAPPAIPFLSNLSGGWITAEEATDAGYWARHLRQPVRFADGVGELLADPRRILLEVGPGRTLATFCRHHPRRAGHPVVASLPAPAGGGNGDHGSEGGDAQAAMVEALGRLWLAGRPLGDAGPASGEGRRRVPLPTYPFERQRYWIEPAERAPATAFGPGAEGAYAGGAFETGTVASGAAETRAGGTRAVGMGAGAGGAIHTRMGAAGANQHGAGIGRRLEKRQDPADWFYLPAWRPLAPPPKGAWRPLAPPAQEASRPFPLPAGDARRPPATPDQDTSLPLATPGHDASPRLATADQDASLRLQVPLMVDGRRTIADHDDPAPPPLRRWLLLVTAGGLAARWAQRLAHQGRDVVTVVPGERFARLAPEAYVMPPAGAASWRALGAELRAAGWVPEVVVHAWTLEAEAAGEGAPAAGGAGFEAAQERGFYALLELARELAGMERGRPEETPPAAARSAPTGSPPDAALPAPTSPADAAHPASTGSPPPRPHPGPTQEAPAIRLIVLSHGLVQVHAAEPLRAEKAPLLALCRVLPQEHPEMLCRAFDLVPPGPGSPLEDQLLARLTDEAGAGPERGEEELVAFRGLQGYVPAYQALRLDRAGGAGGANGADGANAAGAADGSGSAAAGEEGGAAGVPAPLRRRGVYLLTGGLEGNGFAIAGFLARAAGARLALLGAPQDAADAPAHAACAARIAALRAAGAEVLELPADLADETAVTVAVVEAEARLGEIHGVIHAAGTAGERTFRLLSELGREECAWHFAPRIHGLLALDKALAGRRLDFCLALSSLGAVLGGVAYGAYAAANLFLDAFVEERRRAAGPGEPAWVALDWDLWAFEHEAEQITEVRGDLAGLAMTPREGEEALALALRRLGPGIERLLVSTADLPARVAERRRRTAALRLPAAARGPLQTLHPRPLETPYTAPETEIERRIAEVWQQTLGFASIGVHDNFFELGGDSFIAIQVVARLNAALGVELPVAKLYQGLTIRTLAALVAQDESAAAAHLTAQLAERRESMGRRKELLAARRAGAARQKS